MSFVFSRRFYVLAAIGLLPLSVAWSRSWLVWATLVYDVVLLCLAVFDYFISKLPVGLTVERQFESRFAIGATTTVRLVVQNTGDKTIELKVKDEFPPGLRLDSTREADMILGPGTAATLAYSLSASRRGEYVFGSVVIRFHSRLRLVWRQYEFAKEETVKVYPNLHRAREAELMALGARSLVASHRKSSWRGEGREFESLRDYVRGDELRHLSWTATARRGKLTTRQYQIERDQTILIALDAGRLMTGRIGTETKFDFAIHAALALMSAAARSGDNSGLVVFGRRVARFIPPQRGHEHIDAVLEALHAIEPEMIEPSYSRAFQFIATNCKRRALVVVLTDVVDEEGSQQLLSSLKILRPRHLPLIVTIGDRDLKEVVRIVPDKVKDIFTQSVAEEIIFYREAALRIVESQGGLALDVTSGTLVPRLLETYLKVKETGRL